MNKSDRYYVPLCCTYWDGLAHGCLRARRHAGKHRCSCGARPPRGSSAYGAAMAAHIHWRLARAKRKADARSADHRARALEDVRRFAAACGLPLTPWQLRIVAAIGGHKDA